MSTNQQQNSQQLPQQNQLTLNQLIENINKTRDDILRTQSDSNTTAITGYDGMTRQLQFFITQIQNQEKEIVRLQELCTKNNIDFAIPPQQVVLPANEAVIPPAQEGEEPIPVVVASPPSPPVETSE